MPFCMFSLWCVTDQSEDRYVCSTPVPICLWTVTRWSVGQLHRCLDRCWEMPWSTIKNGLLIASSDEEHSVLFRIRTDSYASICSRHVLSQSNQIPFEIDQYFKKSNIVTAHFPFHEFVSNWVPSNCAMCGVIIYVHTGPVHLTTINMSQLCSGICSLANDPALLWPLTGQAIDAGCCEREMSSLVTSRPSLFFVHRWGKTYGLWIYSASISCVLCMDGCASAFDW